VRKLAWILAAALFLPLLNSACGKTNTTTPTTNEVKETPGAAGTYKETPQRKKLAPP